MKITAKESCNCRALHKFLVIFKKSCDFKSLRTPGSTRVTSVRQWRERLSNVHF